MAIVSMSKLNLVAMSYDKSAILNALQRTGATEVKLHYEAENTVPLSADCEQLRAYLGSLEAVLSCLSREAEEYNKANKIKTDALADGFEVAYNEFIAASGFKAEADALAERVNALADDRREATVRLAKLKKTAQTARLYSALEHPFDYYCNTTHTRVRVGSVPLNSADALAEEGGQEGGQELFCASVIASDGERALVVAAYHKAVASAAEEILQKYNFTACPFAGDTRTGAQLNAELEGEISALEERIAKAGAEIYGLNDRIRPLKIYCDYLGFEIEKCELSEKMRATQTTFLLEAYVPEHEAEAVRAALDEIVRLVGMDALSSKDRLTMETAKIIREDYLHQNAFDEIDTYTSMRKQFLMLILIYEFDKAAREAIANYADLNAVLACSCKEKIGRAKYIPEEGLAEFDDILRLISAETKSLIKGDEEDA